MARSPRAGAPRAALHNSAALLLLRRLASPRLRPGRARLSRRDTDATHPQHRQATRTWRSTWRAMCVHDHSARPPARPVSLRELHASTPALASCLQPVHCSLRVPLRAADALVDRPHCMLSLLGIYATRRRDAPAGCADRRAAGPRVCEGAEPGRLRVVRLQRGARAAIGARAPCPYDSWP